MKLFMIMLGLGCSEEKQSLDDCETNIASDVPDFYQKYFLCVDIEMNGDSVVISSDGLPPHSSYYYGSSHPNYADFDESRGSDYTPNPNEIEEQSLSITVPAAPSARSLSIDSSLVDGEVGSDSNEYGMGTVGVALNGVSIFNSLAAPGDVIENEVYSFDSYNGHPEMSGNYHYHTDSAGPLEVLERNGLISNPVPGGADLEVYGMMCDGTVVMGCTELEKSLPDSSDFDAQNGHQHDLVDDAGVTHFSDRYHVHVCTDTFTDFLFTPEIQFYDSCE